MRRATLLAALILAPLAFCGLVALAIAAPWASSTGSASPSASFTCDVKTSCDAGEVEVFRMSATANAHAGTPSGSAYDYVVCCGDVDGLGTNCSGAYDTVLTLSAADNAHVASDGSYPIEVCLSVGDEGIVDCTYGPSCDTDYACLATISGGTNAHVADCDGVDDYDETKVCCLVTPDNCPDVSNPGQENTDGDEWGDACDNCLAVATPWFVPVGDDDCDGFTTTVENYVGTDPADDCPDVLGSSGLCPGPSCDGDDCWPPDLDVDREVDIADVMKFKPVILTLVPPSSPRFDFDGDGEIDIADVMKYKPVILKVCTP